MGADNTLQLVLDATTNVLTAIYSPPPAPQTDAAPVDAAADGATEADSTDADAPAAPVADLPSWDSLAAMATAQGWSTEALDNHAVIAFIDLCRQATEPVQVPVGKLIDGSFDLEVDAACMSALVTLHPPKGGKPVSLPVLRQAIAD